MSLLKKRILFFAILSLFFIPLGSKSEMTGGNFRIFADNFSILSDQYSTGGNYGLYSTGGEFSAGIVENNGAVGSISFGDVFDFANFDEYFILDDGISTTTFWLANAAGAFNGTCASEFGGGALPATWTDCQYGYLIDLGGGADVAEVSDRIAATVNTSTSGITATSNGAGTVYFVNTVVSGAAGNAPIEETVASNNVVFTGMSSTGGNLALRGGFQAMELGAVSLQLNTSSISLGTLSLDSVSTASVIATVSSDGGYVLSATEDGNFRSGVNDIDDIAAGNVTAGTEGYGIRTAGDNGLLNAGDAALSGNSLSIAQSNSAATDEQTTVTFRAAIDTESIAGNYAHTVTFSLTSSL